MLENAKQLVSAYKEALYATKKAEDKLTDDMASFVEVVREYMTAAGLDSIHIQSYPCRLDIKDGDAVYTGVTIRNNLNALYCVFERIVKGQIASLDAKSASL